jgi:DNA invertase Pin-like site-specific DNA recombinase
MWVVMLLNEREKEALMIELLNKGIPVREIAKKAHVSFTYIKKTRAKITGKADEDTSHCHYPLKPSNCF